MRFVEEIRAALANVAPHLRAPADRLIARAARVRRPLSALGQEISEDVALLVKATAKAEAGAGIEGEHYSERIDPEAQTRRARAEMAARKRDRDRIRAQLDGVVTLDDLDMLKHRAGGHLRSKARREAAKDDLRAKGKP